MAWRKLTPQPWEAIRVHLPPPKASPRGGRPRVEDRRCFEGIRWLLWTGAQWRALPRRYGSPSPCGRRLKEWEATGVLLPRWRAFLGQLHDQQKLRWDACFADGSFIPAKQGGPTSARRHVARGQRGWCWARARVLRWEQTWRRHPRRRAPASSRPSRRSPSGGPGSRGAPASGPRG